jgi:2-dehydro-3-deoxyphosphooctonate aldolase (KDO 8-P synthase)
MDKVISVGYGDVEPVKIGGSNELVFLGGPCAIEDRDY